MSCVPQEECFCTWSVPTRQDSARDHYVFWFSTSHGHSSPHRGLFSCPIRQRQPYVVNTDEARRYCRLVQNKIFLTRPPPTFRPLHQALPHVIQVLVFQFVVGGKDHSHESSDRGCSGLLGKNVESWCPGGRSGEHGNNRLVGMPPRRGQAGGAKRRSCAARHKDAGQRHCR